MYILILVNLLVGLLLITLGYLIYHKKKYQLIAGFNDLSTEQKRKVNIKRLSKSAKNFNYFVGVSIAVIPSFLYIVEYIHWGMAYPVIIGLGFLYLIPNYIISYNLIKTAKHNPK